MTETAFPQALPSLAGLLHGQRYHTTYCPVSRGVDRPVVAKFDQWLGRSDDGAILLKAANAGSNYPPANPEGFPSD